MAKKKRNGNAKQWQGYSDEDKKQSEMEMGKMKMDNGFYNHKHCKRQSLF